MMKAVFTNKNNKRYASSQNEKGENINIPVKISDENVWVKAETKISKNGKAYKVLDLVEYVTKSGVLVFVLNKEKKDQ